MVKKGEAKFGLLSKSSKKLKTPAGKRLLEYCRKNIGTSFDHAHQEILSSSEKVFNKKMIENNETAQYDEFEPRDVGTAFYWAHFTRVRANSFWSVPN